VNTTAQWVIGTGTAATCLENVLRKTQTTLKVPNISYLYLFFHLILVVRLNFHLCRILLVECSPSVCKAGEKCGNQCFEKRLYPPLVPYRTETRGWGLKTLESIRKGKLFKL
jgi:hypothetical protein